MTSKSLKVIYDQVFAKIRKDPLVRGHERGLLYKIIQIILGEEHSPTQEKTQAVCQPLGIKKSSYRQEDYKIIADLIDSVFIERQALAQLKPVKGIVNTLGISNLSLNVNQHFNDEEEKMRWFVIAACILVGVVACLQYLGYLKKRKAAQQQKIEKPAPPPPQPSPPIPAALSLVVPAKIVSEIKIGSTLSADNIEYLIDNASYFLSTRLKIAQSNEEQLELTDEYISPDSQREVYLRVDINNGRDLIDKNIPYLLKSNLPAKAEFVVQQLACLKNLSGLEKFNRV